MIFFGCCLFCFEIFFIYLFVIFFFSFQLSVEIGRGGTSVDEKIGARDKRSPAAHQ